MEKIKQFMGSEKGKDILVVIIVILVSLGSFQLGRLSKSTNSSSGIKILPAQAGEYPNQEASAFTATNSLQTENKIPNTTTNSNGKNFFASSRGTKYYSIGCSGGNTIKKENRVYFETKEDAEQAGYELSSSCK